MMEPRIRGSAIGDRLPAMPGINIVIVEGLSAQSTMKIRIEVHVLGDLGERLDFLFFLQFLELIVQN